MGAADSSVASPSVRDAHAATAVAHPNIALVKYWGKRDEQLIIPYADSLSMTLDVFPTTTTVSVDPGLAADTVTLDGAAAPAEMTRRVGMFLDLVRDLAGRGEHATVVTRNTVPAEAGLASSASGMAALATAAAGAYRLRLDPAALSRLARRGSGSAARSIFGGFAVWYAGHGTGAAADASSYAEPVTGVTIDPAMVIALVDTGPKAISSREAMRQTVATSPLYHAWAEAAEADLTAIRAALTRGDLDEVGKIAEGNALGMHATMLAARPAVRYLSAGSLALLDRVTRLRADGISAYATMDAGPNVKVLCLPVDAERVAEALADTWPGIRVVTARCGPGARLTSDVDS